MFCSVQCGCWAIGNIYCAGPLLATDEGEGRGGHFQHRVQLAARKGPHGTDRGQWNWYSGNVVIKQNNNKNTKHTQKTTKQHTPQQTNKKAPLSSRSLNNLPVPFCC